MTREEAILKLEYSKKAYKVLIDEKVDSGKLVGKDVRSEWEADTPLDEVYKSMIDALEIAIKALEQEPCNDVISRQAVLDVIDRELFKWDVMSEVRQMPSVTPQTKTGHWIPVSERLPESCGMYIVTRKIYDCPDTAPIIMSDESWFDGQNTWHNDNRINHDRRYLSDVIAWMPLPEPYKAEGSEE